VLATVREALSDAPTWLELRGRVERSAPQGGDSAATRFRATDDDNKQQLEHAERRAFHARIMSGLYAHALLAIDERHDRPEHGDLAEFFATDLVGPQRGERMARALELFWDRQSDESAHLLVPRIESTIRDMARRSGLTVMREPIGEKPGGTRTLRILLLEIQGAMPDAAGTTTSTTFWPVSSDLTSATRSPTVSSTQQALATQRCCCTSPCFCDC
jgi:hypothetical protein